MAEIIMTYNEVDTSPLLKVIKVKRDVGNERSLTTMRLRHRGSRLESVYTSNKKIEVEFSIASESIQTSFFDTITARKKAESNTNILKREIAKIFKQKEPKKLQFSDDDVFYYAIVTDSVEMEDINEWYATGKVIFTILDGLAHSLKDKTFVSSDKKLTIINSGGDSVYPKLSFTSASDLKMISFILGNDVFQIGKSTGAIVISAGEDVVIDMNDGKITVSGNKTLYRNFNSKRLSVDVGTSIIGIAVNSGATIPVVKAVINEVYE